MRPLGQVSELGLLFHVKQADIKKFSAAISEWDSKHRIVGKTPPETLINESLTALRSASFVEEGIAVVDVGAGSGIVGIPWLYMSERNRAIFVEPDKKKCAFLRYYLSGDKRIAPRGLVIDQTIQKVSRETLESFSAGNFVLLSRAFSGAVDLGAAMGDSCLKDEKYYVFSSSPSGHKFVEWSK